ncbi:MAG: bifunctional hydroxymethylpyrimidine kinase/phosphomethylpyrimidine kinase [Gammaproteobacteria bacterium]|nr:bifunctional hydroxymethylpyrimidine kinase/phosphomethylpyrimidine kinase [Gammaproteobacteria bacterium]
MKKIKQCVLTIAGSDSSGGAGIQGDIKTISAIGCYAASVITVLTAQNTLGVHAIHELPGHFVAQQLESVFNDLKIEAVKIGMLYSEKMIAVVALALQKFKPKFVILDPVMTSKNGCALIDTKSIMLLEKQIFPYATLITPNLVEAEILLRIKISTLADQELAALKIGNQFKVNVLIKGGHFHGLQSSDVLYLYEERSCHWFHAKRINSLNSHGTGCSLSSAIASYLAQDYPLKDAIHCAKKYLTKAIEFGEKLQIGRGCGPVDHFYFLENHYDF